MSQTERLRLVVADHAHLSVARQCSLLKVARSTHYYKPRPVAKSDHEIMKLIDMIFTKWPFYGSRKITRELWDLGHRVNRKRVIRLMKVMGIEAIYQKPNTSRPHPDHIIYPYLLKNLVIDKVNQAWCSDITYVPLAKGFVYLVAIMDWFSRKVLSWRVSITMEADFCVEALKDALGRYGPPEIFNTDQGAQFTSKPFTDVLKAHGVKISMDGKGRYLDNIFIERLWRSLKYEEVFIRAYTSVADARMRIGLWMSFYNDQRKHQALDYKTPKHVFDIGQACGYMHNASALHTYPQSQQQKKDSIYEGKLIGSNSKSLAA